MNHDHNNDIYKHENDKHDHHDHGHHEHDHGEHGSHSNMNIRAAFIHLVGDTIQSIGVIISALVIYFFGQDYTIADPICTFVFSILVMFTTIPLTRECINVLMEGTPLTIEIDNFRSELLKVEGVLDVHDLHVWSLGPK